MDEQKTTLKDIRSKKSQANEEMSVLQTSSIYSASYRKDIALIDNITKKLDRIQELNQDQQRMKTEVEIEFTNFKETQSIYQKKMKEIENLDFKINDLQQTIDEKNRQLTMKKEHLKNLSSQHLKQKSQDSINPFDPNSHYVQGDLRNSLKQTTQERQISNNQQQVKENNSYCSGSGCELQ